MNNGPMQDLFLLVGRLATSVLFVVSGYFKFVRYDFYVGFFGKLGIPMADVAVYAAGVFELAAALAFILGFKTRQTAFALGLYSIAAAALAHNGFGDFNQLTHFLKNLSILGALMGFAVFGGGAYSLDASQARKSESVDEMAV